MLVSAYKITKNPFICNERRKFICVSLFVTCHVCHFVTGTNINYILNIIVIITFIDRSLL